MTTADGNPDEFSQFSPSIPYANELLAALEYSTSNSIKGFSETPSSDALAFLEGIEDADPNSDFFDADDDDNNNGGWGHYQFTSGGRTIKNTLSTWAVVGSVLFASKLLAATLRTCKVARHLCEIRNRSISSYTSNAYLAILVEHLWEIIPTPFKVRFTYLISIHLYFVLNFLAVTAHLASGPSSRKFRK